MLACACRTWRAASGAAAAAVGWAQVVIEVTAPRRGCHLITAEVEAALGETLRCYNCGLVHFFAMHTSCSLTVNEKADPTVREPTNREPIPSL